MIQSDISILRARFFTQFDPNDPQVLWVGKKAQNVNESIPYCRLLIEPGACELVEKGEQKTHLQLGLVSLFVTIPKGTTLAVGYDLRDKFSNLFRDWNSDDRAVRIMGSTDLPIKETDTHVVLGIRFRWESFRTT